jgi:hypothetical protein
MAWSSSDDEYTVKVRTPAATDAAATLASLEDASSTARADSPPPTEISKVPKKAGRGAGRSKGCGRGRGTGRKNSTGKDQQGTAEAGALHWKNRIGPRSWMAKLAFRKRQGSELPNTGGKGAASSIAAGPTNAQVAAGAAGPREPGVSPKRAAPPGRVAPPERTASPRRVASPERVASPGRVAAMRGPHKQKHTAPSLCQQKMFAFFSEALRQKKTLATVHAEWKATVAPKDVPMKPLPRDHMRNGHQYFKKYGRKEKGISCKKALEIWKTFSTAQKQDWHNKADKHNAIAEAVRKSFANKLDDWAGKLLEDMGGNNSGGRVLKRPAAAFAVVTNPSATSVGDLPGDAATAEEVGKNRRVQDGAALSQDAAVDGQAGQDDGGAREEAPGLNGDGPPGEAPEHDGED